MRMDKKQLTEQTEAAFDYVEKLYFECAYLIKEIEGLLKAKDEKFIMGQQRGYQISASSSLGLNNPDQWIYKKLGAYFVPENMIKVIGGRTETSFSKDLKVIYILMVLSGDELRTPKATFAVLSDFKKFTPRFPKLEYVVIPYIDRIWNFIKEQEGTKKKLYKDSFFEFKVNFVTKDLFDINSVQDIEKKLINPGLKKFRHE